MSKSMKPGQPVARQQMTPLTPEEQKEQFMRAYMQKKASLAEAILYNMMRNPNVETFCRGESVVKVADELSTEFMRVVYHQDITIKEDAE